MNAASTPYDLVRTRRAWRKSVCWPTPGHRRRRPCLPARARLPPPPRRRPR